MTPQEYSLTTRLASGCATWRKYVDTLIQNPQIVNISNFAELVSTQTQASGGTTSANLVRLDSIVEASGMEVSDNAVIPSNRGTYLINFLGQFKFTGGASGGNITAWYTINDVAPANSAFTFFLPTSNNYQLLTNVESVIRLNAGDRLKFYWWSDINPAGSIALTYTPAGSNPARPASPSVNVTIIQLS
jgi:hypothetical protein